MLKGENSKERKKLGRGFEALFPDGLPPNIADVAPKSALIPIDLIKLNPLQPRYIENETALIELAKSIEEVGVIQPVLVQKDNEGYILIAGQRRLRAAKLAGKNNVPAVIISNANDEKMLSLALIENLQRENLNALEEAEAYNLLVTKFNKTQEEIAKAIGKDRSTITNSLRLLTLTEYVKDLIREGKITAGHSRNLVGLPPPRQIELADRIIKEDLSVREVEKIVSSERRQRKPKVDFKSPRFIQYKEIERKIHEYLGTKVKIQGSESGKGKIIIEFENDEDLQRIIEFFKQEKAK